MIFGIVNVNPSEVVGKEKLFQLLPSRYAGKAASAFVNRNVALGASETGVATIDEGTGLEMAANKKLAVCASGNIFKHDLPIDKEQPHSTARTILLGYQATGETSFQRLNGQFAAAIWDAPAGRLLLVSDHLGFEPLYYYWDGKRLVFSSSFRGLLGFEGIPREFNFRAIRNYLLFNYNPGLDSLVKNVRRVRPGHYLVLEKGELKLQRYWFLSYRNQNGRQIADYAQELVELTKDAIRIRAQEEVSDPGAFLSGGMDSSSVVGLISGLVDRPTHTFSFRCDNKDVDESHFARVMAQHYKTQHNEIEFTAEELTNLAEMTDWMEEPLCDIGVELGSFILGRAAREQVKYILTGDGGDELYAGHPVYVADKMAALFDRIPAPLRYGIAKTAQLLPDSDKKKSVLVKTRRFAYSYGFPRELLSNRWRIYYSAPELAAVFNPDLIGELGDLNSYEDITGLYSDADGPDLLSRSLYGDYQTLVHFHVDRLRLTRAFGVEARFPLHDPRLIEFSATIPASLKIKGYSKVKYIQRKAMEGILPDEIVFRKDKMGHNVPMKNWMRESALFRELIQDVLSEGAVKRRGFFQPATLQKMLQLHMQKKKDYSHRLYALLILELWLKNNFDN